MSKCCQSAPARTFFFRQCKMPFLHKAAFLERKRVWQWAGFSRPMSESVWHCPKRCLVWFDEGILFLPSTGVQAYMKFVFRTLITPNFFRILLPWLHSLVQLANNNVQQSFCTRQGQSNAADEAQICMPCRSTCASQTQKVLAGLKVSPLLLHFPLQSEAQSRKPQVAACVCANTVRLLIKSSLPDFIVPFRLRTASSDN